MSQGKMIFGQLMEFGPWDTFKYCVRRYNGDYKTGVLAAGNNFYACLSVN